MSQKTRHFFHSILRSSLAPSEFYAKIAFLLETDPLFVPGYLEHLWHAEENGDRHMYMRTLEYTRSITKALFTHKETRKKIEETWTSLELNALHELLQIHQRTTINPAQQILLATQKFALKSAFKFKTRAYSEADTYLQFVKKIDPDPLQRELKLASSLWWNIDTARAHHISHHQHTYAIILRGRIHFEEEYKAVDGVHESKPKIPVKRFPLIHKAVLDLASELNIGLGRVALVLLESRQQTYRHYDSEPYYRGRRRYHLVLTCGAENILCSGDETVNAKEGELWFFDNKVMHRAHNRSKVERVHVIFDGYPLSEESQ